ncbi:MAG: hypothetical protein ACI4BD_00690 [Paludibacteraceae bacterium]
MKRKCIVFCLLFGCLSASLLAGAAERTLLLGPKTIGRAWQDKIRVEPAQFAQCRAGDVLTLYTADARPWGQGALQHPKTGEAIAPQYAWFGVTEPVTVTLTEPMVAILQTEGLTIGGHEYTIARLTHTPQEDFEEKVLYRGPKFYAAKDWSRNLSLDASAFADIAVGDALVFHFEKTEEGAALKLMDFRYEPLSPTLDGVQVSGGSFRYRITEQSQVVQLQLAGSDHVSVRVGGTGYVLTRISRVRQTGGIDEDLSTAQRSPREYRLRPGEVFRGEYVFPADWSGYKVFTAAPFQHCRQGDRLIVAYKGLQTDSVQPQISFREGMHWGDLGGAEEPQWIRLEGQTVVYTLDSVALDNIKTRGFVLTGTGVTLTRIILTREQ